MSIQFFLWRVDVGVKFDKGPTTTHTGCIQGRKGWVSFLSFWSMESHNMSMTMWTPTDWADSFYQQPIELLQLLRSICFYFSFFFFFSYSSMLQRVQPFALWSKNIYVKVDLGTSPWLLDFVLILYYWLWTGESFGCYWCCRRRLGRPRLQCSLTFWPSKDT